MHLEIMNPKAQKCYFFEYNLPSIIDLDSRIRPQLVFFSLQLAPFLINDLGKVAIHTAPPWPTRFCTAKRMSYHNTGVPPTTGPQTSRDQAAKPTVV